MAEASGAGTAAGAAADGGLGMETLSVASNGARGAAALNGKSPPASPNPRAPAAGKPAGFGAATGPPAASRISNPASRSPTSPAKKVSSLLKR